jgi:hypothetical protein
MVSASNASRARPRPRGRWAPWAPRAFALARLPKSRDTPTTCISWHCVISHERFAPLSSPGGPATPNQQRRAVMHSPDPDSAPSAPPEKQLHAVAPTIPWPPSGTTRSRARGSRRLNSVRCVDRSSARCASRRTSGAPCGRNRPSPFEPGRTSTSPTTDQFAHRGRDDASIEIS